MKTYNYLSDCCGELAWLPSIMLDRAICSKCNKRCTAIKELKSEKEYMKGIGKCAKQVTIAVVENKGKVFVGTNFCWNPQKECPRLGMKTGEGYSLGESICNQSNHAEVNVIKAAGKYAKGGILYLIGHTYCCDKCLDACKKAGIKEIIIK